MDQLKEFLKQAIKYRFWIAVGIAALLPVIAYFMTAGTLKAQTESRTNEIIGAEKDAKQYTTPGIPNAQYKPIVEEKTAVVAKDVDASWRVLYGRQAPLLKWPEEVDATFHEWGRKWPEKVAPNVIQDTIDAFVRVYEHETNEVYDSFRPFDPKEGKGIVGAPPKEMLLKPAVFDPDHLPTLSKVWAAQEKLWIQKSVLDVIRRLNDKVKAKDWDSAVVKQIQFLEVASPAAQDQRSMAKGEKLELAPEIVDPSKPAPAADANAPAKGGATDSQAAMMAAAGMGGMMGMSGGAAGATEDVYYLASPNKNQFQVVPIYFSVYVDQSYINDLIVECKNSPMTIQVREFEMNRPSARVQKPVKGQDQFGGMGGGMYGMSSGGAMPGMPMIGQMGRGGRILGMERMMGMPQMGGSQMEGYPTGGGGAGQYRAMSGMMGRGGYGGKGRRGGSAATVEEKRSGRVVEANKERKKKGDEKEKNDEEAESYVPTIADPYFNIVELKLYGQARFYLAPEQPKPESASEATPGATDAQPAADATKEAPAKAEPAKDEAKPDAEAAKDAPAKDEAAKEKAEPAKGEAKDAAPKTEPAKDKGEAPKADAAKDKAEAPKADADTTKTDAPKAEAPKGKDEAPKR